ncbi:adenosylmethionine-8-amino-7-oxononanoate aminotransferase [Klebsiella pneumoniae]|nr:adenosylmethionine-8-amino-7-oxononanoate aminotransferase [Klebsiella pneumoniae]
MKLAIHNEVAVSNDEVRQLDRAYVFHSWSMQGNLNPLVIAGAQGCELWDYEGNTWLDFSSQLVNVNIGYQHPRVLAAMKAQLETLVTIAPATANLARGEAAKRIVDLAPAGFSKVFFTNAGADANENAIRMARLYTGRDKVLSAYRSYHGNTGSAIAATGDWRRVPNEFSRGHVHFFCGGSLNARGRRPSRRSCWSPSPARPGSSCRRQAICRACAPWPTSLASC